MAEELSNEEFRRMCRYLIQQKHTIGGKKVNLKLAQAEERFNLDLSQPTITHQQAFGNNSHLRGMARQRIVEGILSEDEPEETFPPEGFVINHDYINRVLKPHPGEIPESVLRKVYPNRYRMADELGIKLDNSSIHSAYLPSETSSVLDDVDLNSPCFIATAVYGTPFCKELDILRRFRDNKLKTNMVGNLFVKAYYKVSPPIADFIREGYAFKKVVKDLVVQPAVDFIKKYDL